MKKLFLALLALMLLAGVALASPADHVAPLYDAKETGDVFIGTAVSAGDGYYVSGGLSGVKLEHPYVLTSEGKVYASQLQTFTNGLALLTTAGKQDPTPIASSEAEGALTIVSCSRTGVSTQSGRMLYPIKWRDATCNLIQASSSVSMGAAVFDATQGLSGLIVAAWGEGVNRYVMLPVSSFTGATGEIFAESPAVTPAPTATPAPAAYVQWLDNVTATVQGHMLTVKWEQSALENVQEDSLITVFIADEGNSYYSWIYADAADGRLDIPVAPGRSYVYAVQHAYGETVKGAEWRNHTTSLEIARARPFNKYGYKDTEIYLGTMPATDEPYLAEKAAPAEPLTRAQLEDESLSIFLQVTSKYRVKREDTCDMLITLTAPDGTVFCEPASYIFMPELADGDVWNSNLDPLLEEYLSLYQKYEAGVYTITYYFDGTVVNTISFTVD